MASETITLVKQELRALIASSFVSKSRTVTVKALPGGQPTEVIAAFYVSPGAWIVTAKALVRAIDDPDPKYPTGSAGLTLAGYGLPGGGMIDTAILEVIETPATAVVTIALQCAGSGYVSVHAVNHVKDTYRRRAEFSDLVISAVKVDAVMILEL